MEDDDAADAAEEGGAADHHGGDRFDVGEFAGGRSDRTGAANQDPSGEAADQAGKRIDGEQHLLDRDARQIGGVGIVAATDGDTDQEGARGLPGASGVHLKDAQVSLSEARLTGRAGTTVEMACL